MLGDNKIGKAVSGLGSKIGKLAGPIGIAATVLDTLTGAAKEFAMTRKELMAIQNERFTADTQLEIARNKADTDWKLSGIEFEKSVGLSKLSNTLQATQGNLSAEIAGILGKQQAVLSAMTDDYNTGAWSALNASIDYKYSKETAGRNAALAMGNQQRMKAEADVQLASKQDEIQMAVDKAVLDNQVTQSQLNMREANVAIEHGTAYAANEVAGNTSHSYKSNVSDKHTVGSKSKGGKDNALNDPSFNSYAAAGMASNIPLFGGSIKNGAQAAQAYNDANTDRAINQV